MRAREAVLRDLQDAEDRLRGLREELDHVNSAALHPETEALKTGSDHESDNIWKWPLPANDYKRYGRQMIMPEIGVQGQLRIRSASILIVGVGGLGCPAAAYLAGAGVGRIGLVDGDVVELSNLHRQILHTTNRIGIPKVQSAIAALVQTNPSIQYEAHQSYLIPQNALELFAKYDLVLDCTDHPKTRYLISDAAVLSSKPLVSASALKTDGQLIVLNYPSHKIDSASHAGSQEPVNPQSRLEGPCYRCIFPRPPPAKYVVSCGEGGILGPVVGTMGVLMALEAIKILASTKPPEAEPVSMLIFSAYAVPQFRTVRMKGKRANCPACGVSPSITKESLTSGSLDYAAFCGVKHPVRLLKDAQRLAPAELERQLKLGLVNVIDVRDETQFEIAHIPGSINIPYTMLESGQIRSRMMGMDGMDSNGESNEKIPDDNSSLVLVCRLGNDSQLAVQKMTDLGYADRGRWIGDLRGGLAAYRNEVNQSWPDY